MKAQTQHAPAERADWEDLYEQMQVLNKNPPLQRRVETSKELVLLLNTCRQIVYANKACRDRLCVEDPSEIYGCRPGEAMQCIHATRGEGGCGTSEHCRVCGGVNAVLKSLKGKIDIQHCTIETVGSDTPLELISFAMPLLLENHRYVLVGLSEENREVPNAFAKHAFSMQRMAAEIESA